MELQRTDAIEPESIKMRLREYSAGDLATIYALDVVCFAPPFRFSERAMRHFAEARNALTVIAENEPTREIAGFCIAHVERAREGLAAYVVTLDVAPHFRRQGLARQMLRDIEKQAAQAGCHSMELHVSVDNDSAISFYESEGYRRSHVVDSFYGQGRHGYVYRKALGPNGLSTKTAAEFLKRN